MDGPRSATIRIALRILTLMAVPIIALAAMAAASLFDPPPAAAASTWTSVMIPSSGNGRDTPGIAGEWVVRREADTPDFLDYKAVSTRVSDVAGGEMRTLDAQYGDGVHNPRIDGRYCCL